MEFFDSRYGVCVFQHTAARRRLRVGNIFRCKFFVFQHTAARRRLHKINALLFIGDYVSTHSRTEAAAFYAKCSQLYLQSFNTQPHGGGCAYLGRQSTIFQVSTHSRTEAAAPYIKK